MNTHEQLLLLHMITDTQCLSSRRTHKKAVSDPVLWCYMHKRDTVSTCMRCRRPGDRGVLCAGVPSVPPAHNADITNTHSLGTMALILAIPHGKPTGQPP